MSTNRLNTSSELTLHRPPLSADVTIHQGALHSHTLSEEQAALKYFQDMRQLGIDVSSELGNALPAYGRSSSSSGMSMSSSSMGSDRKRPGDFGNNENVHALQKANVILGRANAFTAHMDDFEFPEGQHKAKSSNAVAEKFYFMPGCEQSLKNTMIMLQFSVQQSDQNNVLKTYPKGWYDFHSFSSKQDHIYIITTDGLTKLPLAMFYMPKEETTSPLPDPTGVKKM